MQGHVPGQDAAFVQSRECYQDLEDWMASGEAAGLQHGELEEQLDVRHVATWGYTRPEKQTVGQCFDLPFLAGAPVPDPGPIGLRPLCYHPARASAPPFADPPGDTPDPVFPGGPGPLGR